MSVAEWARRLLLALVGLMLPLPGLAGWTWSGSNTLRMDSYRVGGDKRHSPYAEEGSFISNDLDLSLFGDPAPGQSLRIDFAGTITDSPYRSDYAGVVPEIMRLSYDNSTASLPFSLDLGDQNVHFSELTLNRTLKAARLTLRPNSGSDGRSYWASAVVGSNGQQWRDFDPAADFYRGLSVGMQDQRLGRYSVNLVRNSRSGLDDLPGLGQWAASLTGQRRFDVAGQDLNIHGELAYTQSEAAGTDKSARGYGYYLQLDGRSHLRPMDYRLRYDRYGRDFRPSGSSALADSESLLLEGGWRYQRGLQLRGRLQRTGTELSSANPITTDSMGFSLQGSLLSNDLQKLVGSLEVSQQHRQNAAGSIDAQARTISGSIVINHSVRQQTRLSAAIANVDDRSDADADQRTRQFSLAHSASLTIAGVDLRITPGISATEVETKQADEITAGPTLAIEANRDRERLVLELSRSELDAAGQEEDVSQRRMSLKYELQRGRHAFGVDIDRSLREPAVGEDTDAWHAGMYWRYDLGHALNQAS